MTGALLALVGADTPVGYNAGGGSLFVDLSGLGTAYFRETGVGTGAAGVKKLAVGLVGTESLQATETTMFGAGPAHTLQNLSGCWHPQGKLYLPVDNGNSSPLAKIDAGTLVADEIIGASSASFLASTVIGAGLTRLLSSFQMIPLQRQGPQQLLVSRGITAAGVEREVAVLDVTTLGATQLLYAANVTEQVAGLGPGVSGTTASVASFFVVGRQFNYAGGDPTPAGLYKYTVQPAVAKTTVRASIAPGDIDATWTNFTGISNPGWDQADGNLLLFFSTLDAVAQQDYLVKFSSSTGALLWKAGVTNQVATGVDLVQCGMNGLLGVFNRPLVGTSTVQLIELAGGTTLAQLAFNRGLAAVGSQVWDQGSYGIIGNSGYGVGSGPVPSYLGAYLGAHGNVIPANRWAKLWPGVPYGQRSYVEQI